jgi:hypothetical protein
MVPEFQVGNPTMQLGNYTPAKVPLRKVRVVRDGWYGRDKRPVTLDQVLELPADEAAGAVALGRAQYVR